MATVVSAIPVRLALGLLLSALIGLVAYRRRSLTLSGALGAVITGTVIFGFGGGAAGVTLIAFFISSSLLSHFKKRDFRKLHAAESFDKGGQRDLGQALANGGPAMIVALLGALVPASQAPVSSSWALSRLASASMLAFVGALATVNADTWATELGVLSRAGPRLLTTFRQVEAGTSGGITLVGVLAACAGALFISAVFVILRWLGAHLILSGLPSRFMSLSVLIGTVSGVAGSLFDSFLGATVQAMYFSPTRNKETEKPFDRGGRTPNPGPHHNTLIRGWRWLNNDWVNFLSSLFGAGVAAAMCYVLIW